jgi:hypothetical protein
MQIDIEKDLKKGFVFTGKWFTGVITVTEVKESTNELDVMLKNKEGDDYHWFETWDLQIVKWGFERGDYFVK